MLTRCLIDPLSCVFSWAGLFFDFFPLYGAGFSFFSIEASAVGAKDHSEI
jgi:hypothetical protein